LGLKVYQPLAKNRTWVIDAALIDEVILMSNEYVLANEAQPAGKEIATAWLTQLKRVTAGNDVVALAYGNPDVALAKQLAPSELKSYFVYGQERLQLALGRIVRSEPAVAWSVGKSGLSNPLRKSYSDNRKALTRLSRVVDAPELVQLRARLGQLLSPSLDKASREKQLEMQVDVIAPGQTTVAAVITGTEDDTEIVPEAVLTLNSTVIDSRVTWFTTGAAILLLLAAVAQSVRRVRRRSK